jgi:anthranilate synthase component 2
MRTIIIDNYDSFTFNLQHYLEGDLNESVPVKRNDEVSLEELESFNNIVLSPGPGLPQHAGITLAVLERFSATKRILGVCLGHQAIGMAFGGKLENLTTVHHGLSSRLNIVCDDYLFNNFPHSSAVGRYHSWVVSNEQFPACLEILATDEAGEIMAIRHRILDVRGVQFHPESIMTTYGRTLIRNWALNHH